MNISPVGRLVLVLHERAKAEGRIVHSEPRMIALLETLAFGYTYCIDVEGIQAGQELRSGRVVSDLASMVRNVALKALKELPTFLVVVDRLGYTPQVVRAGLSYHYRTLAETSLDTFDYCVYLDLKGGIDRLGEPHKRVCQLLAAQFNTQEIARELCGPDEGETPTKKNARINGSRVVNGAMRELSNILGVNPN